MSLTTLKAMNFTISGDYEQAIALLEKESLQKAKEVSILANCYLLAGQFENAYKSFALFIRQFHHEKEYKETLEQAQEMVTMFEALGFNNPVFSYEKLPNGY